MNIDSTKTYIGIVENNEDPKRIGRCRIRVIDVFDQIPTEDIPWASPWKDLNGNTFNVPEKGKIVTIVFESGNIYKPEYIYAEHYNINLENKIKNLSMDDYLSMKSVIFDQSTQIYRNKSEGLKVDHEYTNINLDKNGNILLNLRDNKSIVTMGSSDADEEAVLGTTFMKWFDEFVSNLIGESGGPYIGNLLAPVIANPEFIAILQKYRAMRSRFVSKHVRISKNDQIIAIKRPYVNQKGDQYKSVNGNSLSTTSKPPYETSSKYFDENTGEEFEYQPVGASLADNPAEYNPNDYLSSVEYDIPTSSLDKSKYENGKLPRNILSVFNWASGSKNGKWVKSNIKGKTGLNPYGNALLTKEASSAFDSLMDLYENSNFPGKSAITIADGYRTYDEQSILYRKLPSGYAAKPGTSNHGWAIAVDISGITSPYTPIKTKQVDRTSAFRTPVYQWFFNNSWKFGIYNPWALRDGKSTDEYWHWEYHGDKGQPGSGNKFAPNQYSEYLKPFTKKDEITLRKNGVSQPTSSELKTYFNKYPDRSI